MQRDDLRLVVVVKCRLMIGKRLDGRTLLFAATIVFVSLGLSACNRDVPSDVYQVRKTEVTISLRALGINHSETFKEVRANELPKAVLAEFRGEGSAAAGIADAGQPFNSTDVIQPGLPLESLVVAGLSQHYCALSYWEGGMVMTFKTSIFELADGAAWLVWMSIDQGGFNLQDLKGEIESGRMLNDLRDEAANSYTRGVDGYVRQIREEVYGRWALLIAESVRMRAGKLAIAFEITRDGDLENMRLVASSGDAALDCSAWRSITASNPFPSLPREFTGPYLQLRIAFYNNLSNTDDRRDDLRPVSVSRSDVRVSISAPRTLRMPVGGRWLRLTSQVLMTSELNGVSPDQAAMPRHSEK